MTAGDLLINLYHRPPGLEYPAYSLLPALLMGLAAALIFLALIGAFSLAGLGAAPRSRGGLLGLALVAGALLLGFQWAEATPYIYARLLPYGFWGGLLCAGAGHLALQFSRRVHEPHRRLLLLVTSLAYVSTALHLAAWLYMNGLEDHLGYEASRRLERALNILGTGTIVFGSGVLAVRAGSALESRPWNPVAVRWLVAPAPYAALAFALFLWRGSYGDHPSFTGPLATLVGGFPLVALVAAAGGLVLATGSALRLPFFLTLTLLLAGAAWLEGPRVLESRFQQWKADPAGVRRVIFVTSDALRSDVLEPYGGREIPTPHLNTFAGDCVVFDEAISSASWTLPAFAGMFTGLNPGVFDTIGVRWRMNDAAWSLAERLSASGYYTGAIGMNPLLRPRHGLDQGFLTYDFFPRDGRPRTLGARALAALRPDLFRTDRSSEELKNLAVDWIARHRDKDFFLWLHFWDPHTPLGPPPEFRPSGESPASITEPWERSMEIKNGDYTPSPLEKAWIRRLYLGEVRYVDAMFGALMQSLKQSGLYEDSLIIFASDHGEEFWDHDAFGHGQSLFHELIHVPLMIKLPGRSRTGRVPQPVSTVSLTPTLLDFAAVGFDPAEFSAPSLAPLCNDPASGIAATPIYSETAPEAFARHRWGVRFDDYEYLQGATGEGREELYNLAEDPDQRRDVAPDRPEPVAAGRHHIRDYHGANEALRERHEIEALDQLELAPEDLDHLRKLGYI